MVADLSRKGKMQGTNIELLNCVPILRTRFNLCLPIVVPTHVETVVKLINEKSKELLRMKMNS